MEGRRVEGRGDVGMRRLAVNVSEQSPSSHLATTRDAMGQSNIDYHHVRNGGEDGEVTRTDREGGAGAVDHDPGGRQTAQDMARHGVSTAVKACVHALWPRRSAQPPACAGGRMTEGCPWRKEKDMWSGQVEQTDRWFMHVRSAQPRSGGWPPQPRGNRGGRNRRVDREASGFPW